MSDNNHTYIEESGFFDILKSIMGRNPKKAKQKVLKNGTIVDSDYKYQKPVENTMGMTPADYAKFRKAVMYGNDEQNIRENLAKYFENNPKIKDMLTEADRVFNSIPKSEGDAQTRYRAALTKAMSTVDDPELNKLARVRKFSDSKINVLVNDYDSGKFTPADAKGKKSGTDKEVDDNTEDDEEVQNSFTPYTSKEVKQRIDSYKASTYKDTDAKQGTLDNDHMDSKKSEDLKQKQNNINSHDVEKINSALKKAGLKGELQLDTNNGYTTTYNYIGGKEEDFSKVSKVLDNLYKDNMFNNPIQVEKDGDLEDVDINIKPRISKTSGNRDTFKVAMSNSYTDTVSFNKQDEHLKRKSLNNADGVYTGLGVDTSTGKFVTHDMNTDDISSMIVAGGTGSGKTVFMNSKLCSLIANNSPEDVQIAIIDGKGGSYEPYRNAPHMWGPVYDHASEGDVMRAYSMLVALKKEFDRRQSIIGPYQKLSAYNAAHPDKKIPHLLFVFDEYAAIRDELVGMGQTQLAKKLESMIKVLMKKGRSAGMETDIILQNVNAQVLPTDMKGNADYKIIGDSSAQDSQNAINSNAAVGIGRGNFVIANRADKILNVVRAPYVDIVQGDVKEIVDKAVQRYKNNIKTIGQDVKDQTKDLDKKDPNYDEKVQKVKQKIAQQYLADPTALSPNNKRGDKEAEKLKEEKPKKELKKLDDELKDAYIQPIKEALNEIDPDDLDTLKEAVEKIADVKKNLDKRGIEVPGEITDIMKKFKPVMESGDDYERAFNLKKFLKGNVPENEWVQEQEDRDSKLEKLPKNIKEAGKKRQQKKQEEDLDYDVDVKEEDEEDISNKVQQKMTKDKGSLIKQIQTFESKYKNKNGKPSKFNRVTEEKKKDFDDRLTKRKKQLSQKQSGLHNRKPNPDVIKRLKESIDKAKERQRISDNITKYEDEYSDRTGKDVKFRRTSKVVDDIE